MLRAFADWFRESAPAIWFGVPAGQIAGATDEKEKDAMPNKKNTLALQPVSARTDGGAQFAEGIPAELQKWADDLFDAVKATPFDIERAATILKVIKSGVPIWKGRPDLKQASIDAATIIAKHFGVTSAMLKAVPKQLPPARMGLM